MRNAILAISALLLETFAWSEILDGPSSDTALTVYLAAHGLASLLFALLVIALLPGRLAQPRIPALMLLTGTGFALPLLGFAATLAGMLLLRRLGPYRTGQAILPLAQPELDPYQKASAAHRHTGLSSFLKNAQAPETARLRALTALQTVPGRVSTPLLRSVLADSSEDIRLLAYGMLDAAEKRINNDIHSELTRYTSTSDDGTRRLAAQRLSDLYWELIYQELVQGDLRSFAARESLRYTEEALAGDPDNAPLHLRRGRLLQALSRPGEAMAAYQRARDLGLPPPRIAPYLAELAFAEGDFATARSLMRELAEWQTLPRLAPVVRYWNAS